MIDTKDSRHKSVSQASSAVTTSRDDSRDFTVDGYRGILLEALNRYRMVPFGDAPGTGNVLFLRHDCDASLNRALAIAQVEHELGVKSTYFLLPHCLFYNLLERSQSDIVATIIGLGHDIGLHFDPQFHGVNEEAELDALVAREAGWLSDWFGVQPIAVSFHNPDAFTLSCERDDYGGLVNCYSEFFKRQAGYCSDSNGYWRHERMLDVVSRDPTGPLQILTHPEWWQEEPMPPRARIMRAVVGRAGQTMRDYDRMLDAAARHNIAGPAGSLRILADRFPDQVAHVDRLWSTDQRAPALLFLWHLITAFAGGGGAALRDLENELSICERLLRGETVPAPALDEACIRLCRRLDELGRDQASTSGA